MSEKKQKTATKPIEPKRPLKYFPANGMIEELTRRGYTVISPAEPAQDSDK